MVDSPFGNQWCSVRRSQQQGLTGPNTSQAHIVLMEIFHSFVELTCTKLLQVPGIVGTTQSLQ